MVALADDLIQIDDKVAFLFELRCVLVFCFGHRKRLLKLAESQAILVDALLSGMFGPFLMSTHVHVARKHVVEGNNVHLVDNLLFFEKYIALVYELTRCHTLVTIHRQ